MAKLPAGIEFGLIIGGGRAGVDLRAARLGEFEMPPGRSRDVPSFALGELDQRLQSSVVALVRTRGRHAIQSDGVCARLVPASHPTVETIPGRAHAWCRARPAPRDPWDVGIPRDAPATPTSRR